jgi:hypothetical protein
MRSRSGAASVVSILLSALFSLGGAFAAARPVAAAASPAIMVVGDSISQGSAGDFTWRYRLYKHLVSAGVAPSLVGPRNDLYDNVTNQQGNHDYADPNFPQNHDAIWGHMLADEMTTIQAEVAAATPDYVLVLLGINDLGFGRTDPAGTEANLRTFIANARAARPDLKLVLGKLLPTQRAIDDSAFATMVADYNTRLVQVASDTTTPTSPIAVANDGVDIVPANDLYDGTHPNAAGEVKIAAGFADALSATFGVGTPYPRPYPVVPIGPQTPPQLTVTPGDGAATLAWTGSPGATGYYVYARETDFMTSFDRLPIPLALSNSPWTGGFIKGGNYEIKLRAVKGTAEGVYSNVVTTKIGGATPGPATGLSAAAADGQVTLTWTAGANASSYLVWVRNVTDGETAFTQLPYPVQAPSWTGSFQDGVTYDFELQSLNGMIRGGFSNVVEATPTGPTPAGVTDLAATAGDGQATLTWTAVAHATGYYVWERNDTAGETAFSRLPLAVPAGEWTGGFLENGAVYEFKLQSVNGRILGGFSNVVKVQPTAAPPAAATGLTATAGDGSAALSWTGAAGATGYSVLLRNVTANETAFTTLPWPVPGPRWTADSLVNGATYEFELQSVNGLIAGGTTAPVRVTPTAPPPPAPSGLTATAGSHSAKLSWTPAPGATGYYVYERNVTGGDKGFTKLPYAVSGSTWTAGLLTNGGTYQFELQSLDGLIVGATTGAVTVVPTGPAPAAPTGLTATSGDSKALLTWSMPRYATCVYILQREVSPTASGFARLPYPVCDDEFTAGGLVDGATYQYEVQAYDDLIAGGTSAAVTVTPLGPPPPGPESLTAIPGNGKVTLHWNQASHATSYYIWQKQDTFGVGWTRLPYPVSGDSFVGGSLVDGAQYEYEVQSVDGLQPGGFSNALTVVPLGPTPEAPGDLSASASWHGTAALSWSTTWTATGYFVYLNGSQLPYPVTGGSWTAGDLIPGQKYTFQLQAVNGLQRGDWSNVVTVTIPLPPAPTGMTAVQHGPYQARLTWNPVRGADAYFIYYGVSTAIYNFPTMTRLLLPVTSTTFDAGYLIQHGIYFFAVTAVKNGVEGPMSSAGTMTPLMDNPMFWDAHFWLHGYTTGGDTQLYLSSSTRGRIDHGMVLVRAFIQPTDPILWAIGDQRSWTAEALVPSRATIAWDTVTGEWGVHAARSCEGDLTCHDALPIVLGTSGAGDGTPVSFNYVSVSVGPDGADLTWKLTQSQAAGLPLFSQHIDGSAVLDSAGSGRVNISMLMDGFPSYEAYEYPRFSDNGIPTAITLATCDQAGPGALGLLHLNTTEFGQRTCP